MQEIYDLGEGPLIVIGISCSLWCFGKNGSMIYHNTEQIRDDFRGLDKSTSIRKCQNLSSDKTPSCTKLTFSNFAVLTY